MRLTLALIGLIAICTACVQTMEPALPDTNLTAEPATDPHIWLEEVEGEAALDWVRAQNARSLAELQADPLYAGFERAARDILTSKERIPYGSIRDGLVYNFWQDETHVRGLWRRTPLASYKTDDPDWETVLDIDALAQAEGKNWVFKGSDCFKREGGTDWSCLVSLSDGGKDAVVNREFDLATKSFVEGGFVTEEAKQSTAWAGPDTLLIGTDYGDGTLTESGYPFIVKRWQRGTPLSEAIELFRGEVEDVSVQPWALELEDGRVLQGAVQADTFFTYTFWLFPEDGSAPRQWPLPPKSMPEAVYDGRLLVALQEDWTPQGSQEIFLSGDLVGLHIETFLVTGGPGEVELVFRPSRSQALNGVAVASGGAYVSYDDNVVGRIASLARSEAGWRAQSLDLPGTGQAGLAFADRREETVFLNYEGFLTPDSLLSLDTASGEIMSLKSLPAKFDASGLVVEQRTAVSSDGTSIPYFVIRRDDIAFDGTTPTLLYGYGGFQISMNPSYSGTVGRLWLEQGGAYVLANIRGGGEFGPDWHQAGLKQKRQLIYDDFIAVAQSLIERGVTSPERLGIMGGSNGGLLMGVMITQRPDLWNAVVIQVPLLDMLRYHLLLAGASWVDEYGSPDIPEERAFLETISPYQNFDPDADYPMPLFVTSTKDDRVHPGHARKMAKLFEDAGKPFLYYENVDGGHSAAANQVERAKRTALEFTYLRRQLFPAEND